MCDVFFNEEPSKIGEYFFSSRIIMEKRVFLRAIQFRREFWARAFSNLSDKKASKTVIFEIENKIGGGYSGLILCIQETALT